jgi:hypothetical protein
VQNLTALQEKYLLELGRLTPDDWLVLRECLESRFLDRYQEVYEKVSAIEELCFELHAQMSRAEGGRVRLR